MHAPEAIGKTACVLTRNKGVSDMLFLPTLAFYDTIPP